ncbi:hypothetical protein DSO57_1015597 [Entomophthora muscae]|uniref:Uncharacterized protein n=1 Tax=Entomophthora muscae TaxID=34485 RepID=A0ACC2SI41_9FUNG|nr:hypothetical protein DSO57_1015597 [Entomophthora muscae]
MLFLITVPIFFVSSAIAHMALTEPAPRRSIHHPGYTWENKDYDIISPLGGSFPFPCRGAPVGPVYKAYKAGSNIDIHIDGIAKHKGGHCQFSMTYDQVNFAVLKTIMGDCIISTVHYQVAIPKDAPNGNATFAWTWFNKIGNREMYMNCVDIEITDGSDNGSIKGKKMVVANLPGYPIFPEGFETDYAVELYESQPILTVAPSRPHLTQAPKPNPPSRECVREKHVCQGASKIGTCWNLTYSYRNCPEGTVCVASNGNASCQQA